MANKDNPAVEQLPTTKKPAEDRVSLDEFCARLSETEKRYTLLAAFHASELKARCTRDTATAFAERFKKFIQAPA